LDVSEILVLLFIDKTTGGIGRVKWGRNRE